MNKPKRKPPVTAKKETAAPKLKKDALAELAQAISGKDNYAEVLRFDDAHVVGHVRQLCSTRSIAVDAASNVGGFPFGRLVEVFGQEQVGKTTLTDQVIASTQAMGGIAAVYDSEEKKDRKYSEALGVDASKLLAIQPPNKTVEAAIETTRRAVDHWFAEGLAGKVPLTIVWDSVAGMPTSEEIENPTTKQPGVAARELRRAMRQLIGKVARAQALFLVVNQQYEKIGGFSPTPGVKRSTYGGGGIRYQATMRIELIRTGQLKGVGGVAVGSEGICRFFKNNLAAPRDEEFAIEWGKGFVNAWSIVEKLKAHRYITSGGGWYEFAEQGAEPVRWQGGWQGLASLLEQDAALYQRMAERFMQMPAGPKE